jgi:hypothetical protein
LDESNVITSSELWAIFGIDDHDDEVEESRQPPPHPNVGDVVIDARSLKSHIGGVSWQMLTNREDKLQSSNGAAVIALAMMGGPQPPERHEDLRRLTHSLYVKFGAATGDATPERYARLDEALDHFSKNWNSAKPAQPEVTLEQVRHRRRYWESIMPQCELDDFCAPQVTVDFLGTCLLASVDSKKNDSCQITAA